MSDYIKREDAKKAACELCDWYGFCGNGCEYRHPIDDVPAADVVERKKGNWRCERIDLAAMTAPGVYVISSPTCSVCGYHAIRMSNYCPECGSDMRGEED